MTEQLALLPGYLTAHLQLALSALLLGVLISVPLGVLVSRRGWLEQPVLGMVGVVQTVPGLALLAVMVPLLSLAGLPSIGFLPAFIGLLLYSLLPILRNTVTGLATVDRACIEAARGVGMTPRQQLLRVELPLAMPVIIAGIRTATVWTVGTATLSTPVGATSLGNYIFSGLQTRNYTAVLVGCLACALLALLLDALVRLVDVGWTRRRRGILGLGLGVLGLLYAYAGGTLAQDLLGVQPAVITIGAKTFTEQYLLAEILAGQVRQATGSDVRIVPSLGSTVAFDALRSGEIDLYVEYSGTVWATLMKQAGNPPDRAAVATAVAGFLRDRHGIAVVCALGFENAYALAMRRDRADRLGVQRISDLKSVAPQLVIGGDYEFFDRVEWQSIRERYGLEFRTRRSMDPSLMYQAVSQGTVDVISAFSTDGRIAALDLVLLEDDHGAIPPYDAIILASAPLQSLRPEVIEALRALAGRIDDGTMRRMNLAVDQDGRSPGEVAREFLRRQSH
ncbi:MAG: glycine betaine ABC transporter substrate-binding protein [Gammaproteobacteria bacterium]